MKKMQKMGRGNELTFRVIQRAPDIIVAINEITEILHAINNSKLSSYYYIFRYSQ